MLAKQLIEEDFLILAPDDTGALALARMDELKVNELPVVSGRKYLGLVSETDIFDSKDIDLRLAELFPNLPKHCVFENQHILDVIRAMFVFKIRLIPIVDESENYMGSVTAAKLLDKLAGISAINDPGAILILETGSNDYVLSQISSIVESNDAKVLCMYVTAPPDSNRLEITLKINKIDIQSVIQTLERYNYTIRATYSEDQAYFENLRERYDSLMKYLNV